MKKSVKNTSKQVSFECAAAPGSQVFIAGTFNNWNPTANPMKDNPQSGHYKTVIRLQPGRHEYKFVVDGSWCVDPKCPNTVSNSTGTLNSVVVVQAD